MITQEFELSSPQIKVLKSRKQLTLNMAGQRAGKTFLMGVKTGMYILNAPKIAGMIAANTHMQLTQTTMREIKKVWKSVYGLTQFDKKGNPKGNYVYGHQPPDHFKKHEKFDNYHGIISFENGGIIFTASLVNFIAHDGKNIGWAELDETKDTKEEALKAVILARLSQPGFVYHKDTLEIDYIDDVEDPENYINWNPCCINTSPSIGIVKWLTNMFDLETHQKEILERVTDPKDYFHLDNKNQSVTISSTYHNAANLSEGYIENRLSQLSEGEALKFVFGYPFARTGNSFFRNFSLTNHVEHVKYDRSLPIHLTFDFNSKPYMTLECAQVEPMPDINEFQIRIFKEYCLASPHNSTEAVCQRFLGDYEVDDPMIFFYGDASGDYRQAGSGDHTQFDTVRDQLTNYISRTSDKVPAKNKNVLNRRDFVDKILERKLTIPYNGFDYTVVLIIDPSCEYLIQDMQWLKEGLAGKLKETDKDPETGVVFEKLGHCFVGETMIETIDGSKRIDSIEIGDLVLTRKGFKKVTKVFDNGIKEVNKYIINDIEITCTPEHKIFTKNKGFIKVYDVMRKDIICTLYKTNLSCKENQKHPTFYRSSTDLILDCTQQNRISKDGAESVGSVKRQPHIDMFGKNTMAQYLKGITSITKTRINQIIQSITLKLSRLKNMLHYITTNKESKMLQKSCWKKQFQLQKNGTHQMMVGNGIGGTQKRVFSMNLKKCNAINVIKIFKVHSLQIQGFVPTLAKTPILPQRLEMKKDILKLENAKDVVLNSKSINGQKPDFVEESVLQITQFPSGKRKVYDIQVEDEHEYFANGLLVHNCSDALEYLIVELLEDYYS